MTATPSFALFKNILIGYAVGVSAIFVPLMLVVLVPSMAAQEDIGLLKALGSILLVPVIATFQGVFFSGVVILGLWIVVRFKSGPS